MKSHCTWRARQARLWLLLAVLVLALGAVAAGCGGDDEEAAPPAEPHRPSRPSRRPSRAAAGRDRGAAAETGGAGRARGGGRTDQASATLELRGRVRPVLRRHGRPASASYRSSTAGRRRSTRPTRTRASRTRSWPGIPIEFPRAAPTPRPRRRSRRPSGSSSRRTSTSSSGRCRAPRASPSPNYSKEFPEVTFVNGTSGAQDTTLKVQSPELLPLQHGRSAVDGRPRRLRLQRARLA